MTTNSQPSNFYCNAPWTGLFLNTDGAVRNCCAASFPIGNIKEQPLDQIINGPVHKQVQQDILENGYSEYCKYCKKAEDISGQSQRQWFQTTWPDIRPTEFNPNLIDIRWSNTCQLRCVYCNDQASSAYATWLGVPEKFSIRQWQDELFGYLVEHKDAIKFVYLLGGEPLLIKENFKLIDLIGEQQIDIVTNLSLENIESNPTYQKLLQKNTVWRISLEAIGNKFEYIRRDAKWDTTSRNYIRLKELNDIVGITMQYCVLSAFSLADTFDYFKSINCSDNTLNMLLGPAEFSIFSFPREVKELAIKEIDVTLERHATYLRKDKLSFLRNVKEQLLQLLDTYDAAAVAKFKEFVKARDAELDDFKFATEWPELAALLEKY